MSRKNIDENQNSNDNSLASVIDASKRSLASKPQTAKRGRPRKDSAPAQASPSGDQKPPEIRPNMVIPATPSPMLPMYAHFYSFIGEYAAISLDFEGFKLSKPENDALSLQTDLTMQMFAPDLVNSKWGALSMLALSVTMTAGSKYMLYLSHLADKINNKPQVENNQENKVNV